MVVIAAKVVFMHGLKSFANSGGNSRKSCIYAWAKELCKTVVVIAAKVVFMHGLRSFAKQWWL